MELLHDYINRTKVTDRLSSDDLQPVLLGLFGEVGSLLTTAKKRQREDSAFAGYQMVLEEEFGDVLWYFTALCRRLGVNTYQLYAETLAKHDPNLYEFQTGNTQPTSLKAPPAPDTHLLGQELIDLALAVSSLLGLASSNGQTMSLLARFLGCYIRSLQAANVRFLSTIGMNLSKTEGRFLIPDKSDLPTFDSEYPEEERLPESFEISITQREYGMCYLRWNGVFIGDPLTDNIREPDDYRFHDVFHLAHAAVLHWAPTLRKLIKQKRKSNPSVDEAQDGGRAIVIEEGLTAWLYSHAKHLEFFEGHDGISFDLLKTLQEFTRGYEVEACPLSLWEQAILQGYRVFREVRKHGGGVVIGDRKSRTIEFRPLD